MPINGTWTPSPLSSSYPRFRYIISNTSITNRTANSATLSFSVAVDMNGYFEFTTAYYLFQIISGGSGSHNSQNVTRRNGPIPGGGFTQCQQGDYGWHIGCNGGWNRLQSFNVEMTVSGLPSSSTNIQLRMSVNPTGGATLSTGMMQAETTNQSVPSSYNPPTPSAPTISTSPASPLRSQSNETITWTHTHISARSDSWRQYEYRIGTKNYNSATWSNGSASRKNDVSGTSHTHTHNVTSSQDVRFQIRGRYIEQNSSPPDGNSAVAGVCSAWSDWATSDITWRQPTPNGSTMTAGLSASSLGSGQVNVTSANAVNIHYLAQSANVTNIAGHSFRYEREFQSNAGVGSATWEYNENFSTTNSATTGSFNMATTTQQQWMRWRYFYRRSLQGGGSEDTPSSYRPSWSTTPLAVRVPQPSVPPTLELVARTGESNLEANDIIRHQDNQVYDIRYANITPPSGYFVSYEWRAQTRTYVNMDNGGSFSAPDWTVRTGTTAANRTFQFTHRVANDQQIRFQVRYRFINSSNNSLTSGYSGTVNSITIRRTPTGLVPNVDIGLDNPATSTTNITVFNSVNTTVRFRARHENSTGIAGWTLAYTREIRMNGNSGGAWADATTANSNANPLNGNTTLGASDTRIEFRVRFFYTRVNAGVTYNGTNSGWGASPQANRVAQPTTAPSFTLPTGETVITHQNDEAVTYQWNAITAPSGGYVEWGIRIRRRTYDARFNGGNYVDDATWSTQSQTDNASSRQYIYNHRVATDQQVMIQIRYRFVQTGNTSNATSYSSTVNGQAIRRAPLGLQPSAVNVGWSTTSLGSSDILLFNEGTPTFHLQTVHSNRQGAGTGTVQNNTNANGVLMGWSLERGLRYEINGTNNDWQNALNGSAPLATTGVLQQSYNSIRTALRYRFNRTGTGESTAWSEERWSPYIRRVQITSDPSFTLPSTDIILRTQTDDGVNIAWNPAVISHPTYGTIQYRYRVQRRTYSNMDSNNDTWVSDAWIETTSTSFNFVHMASTHQQVRIQLQSRVHEIGNVSNAGPWTTAINSSSIIRIPTALIPTARIGRTESSVDSVNLAVFTPNAETVHIEVTSNNKKGLDQTTTNNNGDIAGWNLALERTGLTRLPGAPNDTILIPVIENNGSNPNRSTFQLLPAVERGAFRVRYVYRRNNNQVLGEWSSTSEDAPLSPYSIE